MKKRGNSGFGEKGRYSGHSRPHGESAECLRRTPESGAALRLSPQPPPSPSPGLGGSEQGQRPGATVTKRSVSNTHLAACRASRRLWEGPGGPWWSLERGGGCSALRLCLLLQLLPFPVKASLLLPSGPQKAGGTGPGGEAPTPRPVSHRRAHSTLSVLPLLSRGACKLNL